MNICFIESHYPGPVNAGGAGTYVQLVAREMVKRGHRVSVIARSSGNEEEEALDQGVQIYRAGQGNFHYYFSRLPLLGTLFGKAARALEYADSTRRILERINRKEHVDIVECSGSESVLFAFWKNSRYVVKLHSTDYIWKLFCGESVSFSDKMVRVLERMGARKADGVASPSVFLADWEARDCRLAKPVVLQLYPADPKCFSLENPRGEEDGEPVVFFAGRFERRKGIDVLAAAVVRVVQKYPRVRFRLFGGETKDFTRESLRLFFEKNGCAAQVEIGSHVPKDELMKEMVKSDICVVPSLWDNSPNTVYEAMACGKPVIGSKAGGISELIEDGRTGILFTPGSSEELTGALLTLLRNQEMRERLGKAGREKAKREFDLSRKVDDLLCFYREVLGKENIRD